MSGRMNLQAALQAHRQGNYAAAERQYRAIVAAGGPCEDAVHLLGVLLHQTGRSREALPFLERAVAALPRFADAHSNLGMVLLALGRDDEALRALDDAININGAHWNARALRAEIQERRGRPDLAREDLQAALRANPGWVEGLLRLAAVCRRAGDSVAAIGALNTAAATAPADPGIQRSVGIMLRECGELRASSEVLEALLARMPATANVTAQLAWTRLEERRFLDAIELFQRALGEDPPHRTRLDALVGLGTARNAIGLPDDAIEALEAARRIDPDAENLYCPWLSAQIYSPSATKAGRFDSHRRWAERHAPGHETADRPVPRADPPWRVGFLSGDLRDHAVARFLWSWMADVGGRFAYYAYSFAAREDRCSDALRAHFAAWRPVAGLDDAALRSAIRNDGIDILVDLSGHTYGSRLAALAARAAPIQATWLGYPETTGLATIDYRLTDVRSDPAGEEAWATERLARLPTGFLCYRPSDDEAGAGIAEPERSGFAFGCFNNPAKITPQVVSTLAAVLRRTPGSVLVLKHCVLEDARLRAWMVERFTALGVAGERIRLLAPTISSREHLEAYNHVDLALDTFPYNGTTTSCEALWMGVPVLAMTGERHAGRVGESILRQVFEDAAGDWIASGVDDYVERAARAAASGPWKRSERQALRHRVERSSLMDGVSFASCIEARFEDWLRELA